MNPTKIKARRMTAVHYDNGRQTIYDKIDPVKECGFYREVATSEVHVLDASRYGELVDQMVSAVVRKKGWKIGGGQYSLRDQLEIALRSIGITKGK